MKDNRNLYEAKLKKNDEFYTRYVDIEKELCNYDFSGKSVYCPCDDFRSSEFKNYFITNFSKLGITNFTCTCFDNGDGAWVYTYDGENETADRLEGNGDFASDECTAIRDENDIIVTNPPFSQFKDFYQWIKVKDYLVICNKNCIAWKTIFPDYLDGKTRYGYNIVSMFYLPDDAEKYHIFEGCKVNWFQGTGRWLTNFTVVKNNPPLPLVELESTFKKFDTYDAWNTDSIKKIPDTNDLIGAPIGIIDYLCKEQFEIVGLLCRGSGGVDPAKPIIDGKCKYVRILIKKL